MIPRVQGITQIFLLVQLFFYFCTPVFLPKSVRLPFPYPAAPLPLLLPDAPQHLSLTLVWGTGDKERGLPVLLQHQNW